MTIPSNSAVQNLLPVQAYFDLQGNFITFIGQNKPFYATVNPFQSGLTITNSTIDSSIIGGTTPAAGYFTSIATNTGTIATGPSSNTDITNKLYVDTVAQGLGPKAACQCGTTADITLAGLQTIDGYTTIAGDRVLVKNQTLSQFNGIYIASTTAWTRAVDMDVWSEVPGAYTVLLNGTQLDTGWVCTASATGTINVTAMPWVQFSGSATYYAGTGLTLASNIFSITNVGTAGTWGSASSVPVFVTNAQGQVTGVTNTSIAIANTQVSGLGTMSTQNANAVAITGGTINTATIGQSTAGLITGTTITANTQFSGPGTGLTGTATSLNIGGNAATATSAVSAGSVTNSVTFNNGGAGGVSGSTFNGGSALTVSYNTIGAPSTTGTGASGTWGISVTGNAATVTNGVYTTGSYSNPTWITSILGSIVSGAVTSATTATNVTGGAAGSLLYQSAAATTTTLGLGTSGFVLTAGASAPTYVAQSTLSVGTATNATNATYLAGGVAGAIPWQSATGVTGFTAAGTTGQVLTSNATGVPTWTNPGASITITDDTTSATSYYPLFARITSGTITTEYTSSTKLNYTPSTGLLSATLFSGSGANLTSIPNGALVNSSVTIGSTAVALGATVTTFAGLSSVTSTTFVGALTGNASTATTATTATNATNIGITDDTTTATAVYPTWVTTTTGNLPAKTSSTKLSFVPSTGTLTATTFAGNASSATNIAGGTSLQIPYQTGAGATSFITAPSTASTYLQYNGTGFTWATAGGGGGAGSYTRTNFTATASQTTFTVTYVVGYVEVYLNGVLLDVTDYTATSGTSIVLATAAVLNDIVTVIAYNATSIAVAAGSNTQVQYNSSGNLAGSANMTFDGTTITSAFSGPHNGTVGATTPNTGAFSTISATGVITSTLATGTAPFTVTSTTPVANLSIGGNAATATSATTAGSATTATTSTNLAGGAVGSVPYQSASATTLFLSGNTTTTPQFVTSTGTGAVAQAPTLTGSTGSGSVVLSTSPTLVTPALGTPSSGVVTNLTGTASININGTVGATTQNIGLFTTVGANASVTASGNQGAFYYGTLGYSDTNILASYASSVAGYNQIILQNTSNASTASTNFNVSNDAGTATTNFGELGINSSTFTGTGAFSQAGTVYLSSASTDLAIGTYGANAIHFVVNSGATDAATISSAGLLTANNFASSSAAITGGSINGAIIGGTTPAAGTFSSLTLSGTSSNLNGDFSNATVLSRSSFKTTTTNGATGIYALPNGTSTAASWQATNAADPTNASKILIATNGTTDVQLVSGINGTGTYLPLTFWNNGAEKMRLDTTGNFGIGTGASPSAVLQLKAGTATASTAPLKLTSGTNLTTAEVGAVEYDGTNFYVTSDTSQGRNVVEAVQQFYLSAAGSALTGATQNYFGSTSAASLSAASTYDIECYCYFLKTTAGTIQWIPTFSSALTVGHSYLEYTPVTGFTTTVITGAMVVSEATQQTTTVLTHTATASLTSAVFHIAKLRIRVTTNAACNFRLNNTIGTGSITPQAGSFYTVRKVVTNAGNFVA